MAGMVLEAHCAKKNKTKGSRKVREILHVHHVHAHHVNVHHVNVHILCIYPADKGHLAWVLLGPFGKSTKFFFSDRQENFIKNDKNEKNANSPLSSNMCSLSLLLHLLKFLQAEQMEEQGQNEEN